MHNALMAKNAGQANNGGSLLSLGSSGSILSIGSTGSILSIGSLFSFASVLSAFAARSARSVSQAPARFTRPRLAVVRRG